jgi:hypothetical protein
MLNLAMAWDSESNSCIDDCFFDTLSDDDEEIYDPGRLISGFSRHKACEGNIHLSAYGRDNYALVFDESCLVIYNPNTRLKVASYDLSMTSLSSDTFTSIIADEDCFFLSISNGRMISCFKTSCRYQFILSTDSIIPGFIFTKRAAKLKLEKLLGANGNWLVYQNAGNSVVFLHSDRCQYGKPTSLEAFSQAFVGNIVGHAFCCAANLLWVAT